MKTSVSHKKDITATERILGSERSDSEIEHDASTAFSQLSFDESIKTKQQRISCVPFTRAAFKKHKKADQKAADVTTANTNEL